MTIQSGVQFFHGRREHTANQAGAVRWHRFMFAADPVSLYAPNGVDILHRSEPVSFGVGFTERPMVIVSSWYAEHPRDAPFAYEYDPEWTPLVDYSILNWQRSADAMLFVGATISFTIRNYAGDDPVPMVVCAQFGGPSIASPIGSGPITPYDMNPAE